METVPNWLHVLSIAWLVLGFCCAALLAVDVAQRPQPMCIMNIVWPVTALFGTLWVVWQYFTYGRASHAATEKMAMSAGRMKMDRPNRGTPFPIRVANGTLHCGSGCTLGDIVGEWLVFFFPVIAVWFGWGSIFDQKIFAIWVVDFIFAFAFGIIFQYFTIAPMRGLSFGPGIRAAVKADTFSLTAWQIGMYGFMAFAYFYLFGHVFGTQLTANTPEFWFMMQIAMMCGFVTAYPVNWWLIRAGIKEAM